jgi:formylglycine-generating enzyme required for sulfatase activity
MEFCRWLSREEGSTFRLPTEAEWEYACRAGTTTPYFHGHDPEGTAQVGNVADAAFAAQFPELESAIQTSDGHAYTSPAGSFSPNSFGLYDMHGNVWEWCVDHWHENYDRAPTDGSAWLSENENNYQLLRGGSWNSNPGNCRSANRNYDNPDSSYLNIGLRVVASSRT